MRDSKVYSAVNEAVLECVPKTAKRILDVGCGSGAFAERVKRIINAQVIGITYSRAEADLAAPRMDAVHLGDLNSFDFAALGKFDCAVMSHVLEHLYEPVDVLRRLKAALTNDAIVIVALPNVLMWRQRLCFLRGEFRYQEFGLMDRTHLRFFDAQTASQLIIDAGYEIVRRADNGHFPLPGVRRLIPLWADRVDRIATRILPGLFADQFILVGRLAVPASM